jgi:uncharacterized protein (DUF1810 family)
LSAKRPERPGASALARFTEAQELPVSGFDAALREIQSGAKTGHWIWYVFPQLRGLGTSPMAVRYGLDGVEEAVAYLRDPDLGLGLALAADVVGEQIEAGVPLDVLMGSEIDLRKLVSSMTLFGDLARAELARQPPPHIGVLARRAEAILRAAAALGYPPCELTEERLARERLTTANLTAR